MWVLFAFASALFAGLTSILAKCGIKKTDSNVATAIRTIVVLLFSWLMVGIVDSGATITGLSAKTWFFFDSFRFGYRCVLAVLFSGTADWRCQ